MKRQRGAIIAGLVVLIAITMTIFIYIQMSPSHQAKETIDSFYKLEQEGKFADSWALFHSQMKGKFDKGHYIQDRAHVFMNHFGVTTFTYVLGNVDKVNEWKLSEESEVLDVVYQVNVTKTYKGKYGNFNLNQSVFATKEEDEWKILWDYKK
ncbi:hypothetical protein [Aquibacillus rhizosphaerae]|uniref:DUF4440 domain-containing protein n=1 Tax=Aquibacillus rhizosphaerae TaxID=3051431 RepID=A0ABT7L6Q0_9BACI|nr:hypothetical protein [Aquibacillus sp. LR5S19]MDL4840265.1 hypothetical protein [Aquibacillus sp. LR5S19]